MELQYSVTGMTCQNCAEKIAAELLKDAQISAAHADPASGRLRVQAAREMTAAEINERLRPLRKYQVHAYGFPVATMSVATTAASPSGRGRLKTYYPLMLVFGLSFGVPLLALVIAGNPLHAWMRLAMGSSLVAIAFFKFLDLPKFAEGFSTYDPLAIRWPVYGWLYPFLELGAGVLFLAGAALFAASLLTVVLLGVTSIGVARALRQKRTIQCACLGTIFNLPLTQVTLVENAVMIVMAFWMLAAG